MKAKKSVTFIVRNIALVVQWYKLLWLAHLGKTARTTILFACTRSKDLEVTVLLGRAYHSVTVNFSSDALWERTRLSSLRGRADISSVDGSYFVRKLLETEKKYKNGIIDRQFCR